MRTVPTVPATYIEMCAKPPLKEGHLSNEDSAYCPSYIEMCAKPPLKKGHLSNEDNLSQTRYLKDTQIGEVSLFTELS